MLEAVPPIRPEECVACVVRGQYPEGMVSEAMVAAYREEPYVDPNSQTETYVALKMAVDNWRWAGVPFYLRTGKRLHRRNTQIVVQFRNAPLELFRRTGTSPPRANSLVLGIQPQENICLEFEGKVPAKVIETTTVRTWTSITGTLSSGAPDRVRNAAVRRRGRRCVPVQASGHDRGRVGGDSTNYGRVGCGTGWRAWIGTRPAPKDLVRPTI